MVVHKTLALFGLAALVAGCDIDMPQTVAYLPTSPNQAGSPQPGGSTYTLTTTAPASSTFQGVPSDAAAAAFARAHLGSLQARSIAERREYCGYFYVDSAGQIAATPARPGTMASCSMPAPRPGQGIFASYHTHGAYDRGYDNEVPSTQDLESDFQFNMDGYVSTPGGRVWHVDLGTRSTSQICGRGCVQDDPGYITIPADEASIQQRFTLAELYRR